MKKELMKDVLTLLLVLMALSYATHAFGQHRQAWLDGFDKFGKGARESSEVTLDKDMLRSGSRFLDGRAGGDTGKRVASRLNAIYVRSYEYDKAWTYSRDEVAEFAKRFTGPEWKHMVKVREKEEDTDICVRTVNGEKVGMVILTVEPKELTLVYLDGPVDFSDLASLPGAMGVPAAIAPRAPMAPMPPPAPAAAAPAPAPTAPVKPASKPMVLPLPGVDVPAEPAVADAPPFSPLGQPALALPMDLIAPE